eukprot:143648_1
MPNEAKNITAFRTTTKFTPDGSLEIIKYKADGINYGQHKHLKSNCDECCHFVIQEKKHSNPVSREMIVQLTMDFAGNYYVGTGTIINIVDKKIYVLTAAHNVLDGQIGFADNVWFIFSNQTISSTRLHVYDQNVAIIECEVDFSFKVEKYFQDLSNSTRFGIAICGYPAGKNGELWGARGRGQYDIKHDINNTRDEPFTVMGGQSGSVVSSFNGIIGIYVLQNSDNDPTRNIGAFFRFSSAQLKWICDLSGAGNNDSANWCFDRNGAVLMASNQRKKICDLQIGDEVCSFPN